MDENWPDALGTHAPSPQPDPTPHPRQHHRAAWLTGGALAVAASMCVGVAIGAGGSSQQAAASTSLVRPNTSSQGSSAGDFSVGGSIAGGYRNGQPGANAGNGTAGSTNSATAAQQIGVVDIVSALGYQSAEAAGTGMILTRNGEVLTNNHVVDGATSIQATVVSTGATYTATVVGTDPTGDIAVLQLQGASNLQTAQMDSAAATVGQSVTGVGNAGGAGGTPSAASGTVTATDQTITASDSNGANPETLNGLIEDNAAIQAGDSGGPLYNSSDRIVGMDTAAESATTTATSTSPTATSYAIPIGTALAVANQIESNQASDTVHIGYPAFLGVALQPGSAAGSGSTVVDVVSGAPAAQAGVVAGDVITSLGGRPATTSSGLQSNLDSYRPGQQTTITWTDTAGQSHTATLTLAQGPAD
ncbi:S1-C subfamily serine protease [Antricoccus suffuscus]|uniref:S1-C subfamily serine protease n=1 Tax=Antricoccus suffuscus TaxID=1629062 RepID=A0A2T1A0V5_9ACTN|nr:trypsin-like peptidase domain-containing protein [Antricoccus suffuscus]PRZ42236.1 S1-C subfamily serine protease [Antricoccus suffuscus]